MPCTALKARKLLSRGRAAVFKLYPFTIILMDREKGKKQSIELKIDPGSRTTGHAIVGHFASGKVVLWAANLSHRGLRVKSLLESRRVLRRNRRFRKTRFNNRSRPAGWLPPSLLSRVNNVYHWSKRIKTVCPIGDIAIETVRFDTQKLHNPEIQGIEYQQGTLFGYELREYLLEKWNRTCAYCGIKNVPLEVEHIIPKSKGGSNSPSNLTLACTKCNCVKASLSIDAFLKKDQNRLARIIAYAKQPLRDVAAVNATRNAIGEALKALNVPISFFSGGRTKKNRVEQGYSKDHWIDAACVGKTGTDVYISDRLDILEIKAVGRGCRQMCRVDRFGFPRTSTKASKHVHGFQTGDIIKAIVAKGKKKGTYLGKVAIRTTGNFCIATPKAKIDGISYKYCNRMHSADGYVYNFKKGGGVFSPCLKAGVFTPTI